MNNSDYQSLVFLFVYSFVFCPFPGDNSKSQSPLWISLLRGRPKILNYPLSVPSEFPGVRLCAGSVHSFQECIIKHRHIFAKNRFFFHIMCSDSGFPYSDHSLILPTFRPTQTHILALSLEQSQASKRGFLYRPVLFWCLIRTTFKGDLMEIQAFLSLTWGTLLPDCAVPKSGLHFRALLWHTRTSPCHFLS